MAELFVALLGLHCSDCTRAMGLYRVATPADAGESEPRTQTTYSESRRL
jgi:hypothetical protein